ncbi:hypothetical protein ACIRPX_30705 [Streptomyces sp. NPDC101225]|uniref:hypothetical protein n=1 Tax=Streptomyces sp. NPDC101225 TaxID=3366135 RepID=UPI00382743DB
MQDGEARRTLDELVTLYELEPEVRDLFVEGRSDRNFLKAHLLNGAGTALCNIYAVSDRVHIPDGELMAAGLMVGERGRILWLAQQLSTRIPGHSSVALVADKDFASLKADVKEDVHGLFYTDYSSMEAYALNEVTLTKLLRVSLGAPDYISASSLISAVKPALIALFLIRLCLRDSGTGATIPNKTLAKWDLDDQSEVKVGEVFRLALNGVPVRERNEQTPEKLYAKYIEYQGLVDSEFRNFVNGHDVSLVIVRFLKSECPSVFNSDARRPLQNSDVLEVVLMSCVDTPSLTNEPMFRAIEAWIENNTRDS